MEIFMLSKYSGFFIKKPVNQTFSTKVFKTQIFLTKMIFELLFYRTFLENVTFRKISQKYFYQL